MHKILITGGAGFVGRYLTRYFLERGDSVHVVDSIVPLTGGIHPQKGWPFYNPLDYKNFHFYQEDCREYFKRNTEEKFDYVAHLAAVVGGREMIEKAPLVVADDLAIDANYWRWAEKSRPEKTLCFSSSAAYPIALQTQENHRVLSEQDITFDGGTLGMPDMTYGWAKLTCEYLARLAYERHGLKSVCYRPFSGYGEDQDKAYPFPSICKRVLEHKGKSHLKVWGSGYQERDFIHIEDCVGGIVATMDKISDAEAVNLATGKATNFIEFARLAAEIVGFDSIVEGLSDKPEGVFSRVGDPARMNQMGYEAQINFPAGIQRALAFFEERY